MEISGGITYIRLNHIPVTQELLYDFFRIQKRFMVQMFQNYIFQFTYPVCLFPQQLLVKELADLETNFGIFIRIKGSDT